MGRKIEIKKAINKNPPENLHSICLCCNEKLAIIEISSHNAQDTPLINKGVVFRSSGQYGSTVLDCGVGIPLGWGNEIQIIICDKCLLKKAGIINATKNKRAVIERRPYTDVPVEWSDYTTFAELNIASQKHGKAVASMFKKMVNNRKKRLEG